MFIPAVSTSIIILVQDTEIKHRKHGKEEPWFAL